MPRFMLRFMLRFLLVHSCQTEFSTLAARQSGPHLHGRQRLSCPGKRGLFLRNGYSI
jgi:hypothetical protein